MNRIDRFAAVLWVFTLALMIGTVALQLSSIGARNSIKTFSGGQVGVDAVRAKIEAARGGDACHGFVATVAA